MAIFLTSIVLTKNKRCSFCKAKVPASEGFQTPLRFFCSRDHAYEWTQSKSGQKAVKKVAKKRQREAKQGLKTKSEWLKDAQNAVNAWIRWRDRHDNCISCGGAPQERHGGVFDAGHYIDRGTAKSGSYLRFNTWNIHKQCTRCNRYNGSACKPEYRQRLIAKIGLERVEWLESATGTPNTSIEYYKRVIAVFKKRLRINKKLVDQ